MSSERVLVVYIADIWGPSPYIMMSSNKANHSADALWHVIRWLGQWSCRWYWAVYFVEEKLGMVTCNLEMLVLANCGSCSLMLIRMRVAMSLAMNDCIAAELARLQKTDTEIMTSGSTETPG